MSKKLRLEFTYKTRNYHNGVADVTEIKFEPHSKTKEIFGDLPLPPVTQIASESLTVAFQIAAWSLKQAANIVSEENVYDFSDEVCFIDEEGSPTIALPVKITLH